MVRFQSIKVGTSYYWRVIATEGTNVAGEDLTVDTATITTLTATKFNYTPVTATGTDDGTGAGTLGGDGMLVFVTPDWDGDANHIIVLPSPVVGMIVIIAGAATGGELRSSAPATIAINGGTGASAESAVAANQMVIAVCESATSWKALTIASDGTVAGLEAAA